MGLFDSILRNKIGAPFRSELLNNQLNVYKKIIEIKDNMEQQAISDLQDNSDCDWRVIQAQKDQNDYMFTHAKISKEEFLAIYNTLEQKEKSFIADYIDGSDDTTIYGVLRNSLKNIKRKYHYLPNIDQMNFDYWLQIVSSSELAKTTIAQITGSDKYIDAVKSDNQVISHQTRKKFRR